ncbi:MAG: hypothetical protein ACRDZ2_01155 [Ilumatobacteraceae bacterium]
MTEKSHAERPTPVLGRTGTTGRRAVAKPQAGLSGRLGVERAVGRSARNLADSATRTAATDIWAQAADQ